MKSYVMVIAVIVTLMLSPKISTAQNSDQLQYTPIVEECGTKKYTVTLSNGDTVCPTLATISRHQAEYVTACTDETYDCYDMRIKKYSDLVKIYKGHLEKTARKYWLGKWGLRVVALTGAGLASSSSAWDTKENQTIASISGVVTAITGIITNYEFEERHSAYRNTADEIGIIWVNFISKYPIPAKHMWNSADLIEIINKADSIGTSQEKKIEIIGIILNETSLTTGETTVVKEKLRNGQYAGDVSAILGAVKSLNSNALKNSLLGTGISQERAQQVANEITAMVLNAEKCPEKINEFKTNFAYTVETIGKKFQDAKHFKGKS